MTAGQLTYEEYIAGAEKWQFSGWDFSYLEGRMVDAPLPWDFASLVRGRMREDALFLDMGTGGGEFLASLAPLPKRTYTTEGYGPNMQVALSRLSPLGVDVVNTWCTDNTALQQKGDMPFSEGSFDIIADRHEAFRAGEVARVLKRGGVFMTQQVESISKPELNQALGVPVPEDLWNLRTATGQLADAGLEITAGREAAVPSVFMDIGAVVCYLRMVEWHIPDFSVGRYDSELRSIDSEIRRNGGFRTSDRYFLVEATKGA